MPARTISAYADEETARVVEQIAELEDRSPAQIAAAALRFYARLPSEARAAFRRLEKLGTDEELDSLTRAITRKTLDAEWGVAHRRFIGAMTNIPVPAADESVDENDLLAEAVRLTR
ncbi:hypothetical protein [Azospirillum melinis]